MKKRFVVSLASSTQTQNDAFLEVVKQHGLGYWHWFDDTWLLVDSGGTLTSSALVDSLQKTHPGVFTLVTEIRSADMTWTGYGPNTEQRNMFTWIEKNWK